MPYYYNNKQLTALLCLANHVGQVQYVPALGYNEWRLVDTELHESLGESGCDVLQVRSTETQASVVGTDKDPYRQFLIGFLQNPDRSGSYAIGPATYIQATLFFIERILPLDLVLASEESTSDGEESEDSYFDQGSWLSSDLTFHNDIWALEEPGITGCDTMTFLSLGYIFFFLPRSGKSQALLEHCQTQVFLTNYVIHEFPERTALVRRAMQEYLNRFGRESLSGDGEDCDAD